LPWRDALDVLIAPAMAVISMIMALKVQYVRRMAKEMAITMAWNIKLTNMNMSSLQEIVTRSMP
jgi:hypothetical protein